MKCEDAQLKILLLDSGELPADEVARLEAHLSACAACADSKTGLAAIANEAKRSLPCDGPGAAAMARIHAAARERAEAPIGLWRPAILACAATVAALLGAWFLLPLSQPETKRIPPPPAPEHIDHMTTIVTLVSKPNSDDEGDLDSLAGESNGDLQALARQLLIMEGLIEEEPTGWDAMNGYEAETWPTDLQSNSTPAGRPKVCV